VGDIEILQHVHWSWTPCVVGSKYHLESVRRRSGMDDGSAGSHRSRIPAAASPVVTVVVDPGRAAFVGAVRAVAQGLVHGGVGDGRGPSGGAVVVDSRGAALWASIVGPSPSRHGAAAAAARARADGVRDNGEGGERWGGAARFRFALCRW
jgi:hypothetical protein